MKVVCGDTSGVKRFLKIPLIPDWSEVCNVCARPSTRVVSIFVE
jgi:hypothetical protein